jgi:hypothetical protein
MRYSLGLLREEDLPFAAALRDRANAAIAQIDHGEAALAALVAALTEMEKASQPASRWRRLLRRLRLAPAVCKLDDITGARAAMMAAAESFRARIKRSEKDGHFYVEGSRRRREDKLLERNKRRPSMQSISTVLEMKGSEAGVKFGRVLAKVGL